MIQLVHYLDLVWMQMDKEQTLFLKHTQTSQSTIMQRGFQGDSIFYPDVIYRQSEFVYWMDHNTGGTNWGTDVDGTQEGDILLDGTDSNSQDAGSKLLLDGTDGSGTDGGDNVDLEDGTSTYAVLSLPTRSELSGGTDDYAVTMLVN